MGITHGVLRSEDTAPALAEYVEAAGSEVELVDQVVKFPDEEVERLRVISIVSTCQCVRDKRDTTYPELIVIDPVSQMG